MVLRLVIGKPRSSSVSGSFTNRISLKLLIVLHMLTPVQDKLYERFLTLQRVVERSQTHCRDQQERGHAWRDACAAEVILQEMLQAEVAISLWATAKKFSVGANGESGTIGPLGYRAWTH
jgi:hypothetical protein